MYFLAICREHDSNHKSRQASHVKYKGKAMISQDREEHQHLINTSNVNTNPVAKQQ